MISLMTCAALNRPASFAGLFRSIIENRDLILMGGYTPGQDPDLDLAVAISGRKLMEHDPAELGG